MNSRAKRIWERHYTALGLKLNDEGVYGGWTISERLLNARRRVELLLRTKGN